MIEKIALPCWIALVDDRNLRIAGQDEIAMQRMRQPAFDGAACRYHRLSDHLPAEHPLPARLRAVAAKQVHLDRFEIENGNQVDQSLGHCSAFNFLVSPGRGKASNPESGADICEIPNSRYGRALECPLEGRKTLVSPICFAQL
jgi:hypothetical protein